jgi:uncharacterized protein (DUF934 family)
MTETKEKAEARIWTPGGFAAESWHKAAEGEAIPANGKVILPLAAYLALGDDERQAAAGRIGVLVAPSDDFAALVPHLLSIPLVTLSFPAFSDGRAYSKAALLKSRHGYSGILRATGDVLIDQVELMIRVGFDELEICNPVTLARLAEGRTGGMPLHYQPGRQAEKKSSQYSWRRRAA